MDQIDREIYELDILIDLQRKKLDLLREKKVFEERQKREPTSAASVELERVDGSESRTSCIKPTRESLFNPLLQAIHGTFVSRTVCGQDDATTNSKDDETANDGVEVPTSPPPRKSPLTAMERFSRLATDLANERTLLAWIRTALAAARTYLAFLGVDAINKYGKTTRQICYIGFALLTPYMMMLAIDRYRKIKYILSLRDIPALFDRLSNTPMNICLLFLFLLGLASILSDEWSN